MLIFSLINLKKVQTFVVDNVIECIGDGRWRQQTVCWCHCPGVSSGVAAEGTLQSSGVEEVADFPSRVIDTHQVPLEQSGETFIQPLHLKTRLKSDF